MKNWHKYGLSLVLAGSIMVNTVAAGPNVIQKHKFEYQAEISIDPSYSIQMLAIPEEVQCQLHYPGAIDIRIYNADGEIVPSLIKTDEGGEVTTIDRALAIFPVPTHAQNRRIDPQHLEFKYDNGSIEMRIDSKRLDTTRNEAGPSPQTYLAINPQFRTDTEKIPGRLVELRLKLAADFAGIAPMTVQTSPDLNNWHTIISRTNIAHMNFMGQTLSETSIMIRGDADRFLKLTWLGEARPEIYEIESSFRQSFQEPAFAWTAPLPFSAATGDNIPPNTFDFQVSPAFGANRVRLVTEMTNQVYTGRISTRQNEGQGWRQLTDFQFFRIGHGESEIRSLEKSFGSTPNSLWRIQFTYPVERNIRDDITIQVNRYPVQVYFLTQGNGPYFLAFGQKMAVLPVDNLSAVVADVLRQTDNKYGRATLSNIEPVEQLADTQPMDWKIMVLWAVLVGGVLLLFWMARELFRQISNES